VCVCPGVISVIGLITDITSAASAVPDKRAVCVVRPSSYGVNCGGENDPPSDGGGDGLVQTWEYNKRRPLPLFLIPAEGGA